jgi:ribosomal protein S18 acetylase RimI-like enzyme
MAIYLKQMKTEWSGPIKILPASEKDLVAIAELAGVIWRACYPGIITHAQIDFMLERMYVLDTMREEIQSQGICYDQLLGGNELVGFASYGPTKQPDTFKLHKLYMHPEWQGRGLGSRLLQHCERESRKLGARRLILAVNKRNARAIAAYQRNGFAITESVIMDIGGGFVMDDFVMAKNLA